MNLKYLTTILMAFGVAVSLHANAFPKCEAACNKYYNCVVQAQPNATDQQKDMVRKGCNLNCNKAKYYPKIEKCYDKAQGSCTAYWNCITNAMK